MSAVKDAVEVPVVDEEEDAFTSLTRKPVSQMLRASPSIANVTTGTLPCAAVVRLHGFDLQERPLVAGVPDLPGEVVAARTTVSLLGAQIGSMVAVIFEQGDSRRPIVVGALQERAAIETPSAPAQVASVQVDGERLVLIAEREIVLRCGDATITLTRAGKVIIKGRHIVSRSTGQNKIKGATVDIN